MTLSRDKHVFKLSGHPKIIDVLMLFQSLQKIPPGEHFGEDFGGLGSIFCDFGGTLGDPILRLFEQKWWSRNKPQKNRILVRGAAEARRPHWHKPGRVSDELRREI